MLLPIGIDNFRELITSKTPKNPQGLVYVDKSLLISDVIEDSAKVIVLLRPRRFGKTLNLSMLQHFFAAEVDGQPTAGLFDGLAIAKEPAYMDYQGKSPVIFITFKDVKVDNFAAFLGKIKDILAEAFLAHEHIFATAKLTDYDRNYIKQVLGEKIDQSILEDSLKKLTRILYQHYGVKPILLLDEYDTPLQAAYLSGYYPEAVAFLRNLFSAGLKGNNFLYKAVLTGILRVAKESLFSGLSNVEIYSFLDKEYSQYFGFTQEEVNDLLGRAQLNAKSDQVKAWYNGYNAGGITIYNPWSIIHFIKKQGDLRAYWVNTSDNELVKKLIVQSPVRFQERMATLLTGNTIWEHIDENIVFNSLGDGSLETQEARDAVWSMLLLSGYVTWVTGQGSGLDRQYQLRIPNREVTGFYSYVVKGWLIGNRELSWYNKVLASLSEGKISIFEQELQVWVTETLSYHDVTRYTQESFYHGMLLAFIAGLKDSHVIKSNKESGDGRYDIALIPKDSNKLGIIIELKAVPNLEGLEKVAREALEQIKNHQYVAELKAHGISKKVLLGIACAGKKIKIVTEGDVA